VQNGILADLLAPGLDCDFWRGPTGDSVFHFHAPYPEPTGPGAVGRPTNLRDGQFDPGFVFVFVVATNPAWHQPIINSVVEHFRGATIYLANGPCPGAPLSVIPGDRVALRNELRNRMRGTMRVEVPIGTDFGHRFLAKLALGMGSLLLAPDFVRSPDANLLRNAMWERNFDTRSTIPLAGSDFFRTTSPEVSNAFNWPSGHILLFQQFREHLCLCALIYGHLAAMVRITSQSQFWQGRIEASGTVFVIAPGLRRVVGPVNLQTYIAARLFRGEHVHDDLTRLFRDVDAIPELPDVHVGDLTEIEAAHIERIRRRVQEIAYGLWLERGVWGDSLTDWLAAKLRLGIYDDSI